MHTLRALKIYILHSNNEYYLYDEPATAFFVDLLISSRSSLFEFTGFGN